MNTGLFFPLSAFFLAAVALAQDTTPTVQLVGHTDPVYAVDFTPDGKWIVTGSFDKTLRLWDTATNKSVHTLQGHTGIVLAVTISKDGSRIASGSLDKTIRLWDIPTHSQAASLTGHGSQIYGLAFSPDGKLLASASNDKTVRLWDIEQKRQLKTLSNQGAAVYSVAFSPDGKTLLTGGADKTVRLIEVETGKEIRRFTGPEFAVYSVAFSPNGQTIAAAGVGLGFNRKVFLWNVAGEEPVKIIGGHKDDVYRVQFNRKGNRLLTAGYSGTINIWETGTGKAAFTAKLPTVVYSARYSTDGKRLAVASDDNKTYLIDLPPNAQ